MQARVEHGAEATTIMNTRGLEIPIKNAIKALFDIKKHYALLHASENSLPYDMKVTKEALVSARKTVRKAIATCSTENLLAASFDINQSSLNLLAELGEYTLFKAAFLKVQKELAFSALFDICNTLFFAYKGSCLSIALCLSSDFLQRGDLCYVAMLELLFNTIHKEGNDSKFLNILYKEEDTSLADLLKRLDDESQYLDDLTLDDFKVNLLESGNILAPALVEQMYVQFVVEPKKMHLCLKTLCDYVTSPQSFKGVNQPLSPSFFLALFSSNSLKITAAVLVVAGLAGLTAGLLGVTGIITALSAAAATVSIAGLTTFGVGAGLGAMGFFASQFKAPPNALKEEHDFFVGYPI